MATGGKKVGAIARRYPPNEVRILDASQDTYVWAELERLNEHQGRQLGQIWWHQWWKNNPGNINTQQKPSDASWLWHEMGRRAAGDATKEAWWLGMEGAHQAACYLKVVSRNSVPVVKVDRIATAPWNRKALISKPKYRRAGTQLLRLSSWWSNEIGGDGQLYLEALPNHKLVNYYESVGFTVNGQTSNGLFKCKLCTQRLSDLFGKFSPSPWWR